MGDVVLKSKRFQVSFYVEVTLEKLEEDQKYALIFPSGDVDTFDTLEEAEKEFEKYNETTVRPHIYYFDEFDFEKAEFIELQGE